MNIIEGCPTCGGDGTVYETYIRPRSSNTRAKVDFRERIVACPECARVSRLIEEAVSAERERVARAIIKASTESGKSESVWDDGWSVGMIAASGVARTPIRARKP